MTYWQWILDNKMDIFICICFVVLIMLLIVAFFARSNKELTIQTGQSNQMIRRIYNRPMLIIALLVMLLLCLLAQSTWCYVIMMIIVATLLTDLQFPLMLAAMLMKNKDYFDYMSKFEQRERAQEKIEEEQAINASNAAKPTEEETHAPIKPTEPVAVKKPVTPQHTNLISQTTNARIITRPELDKYMVVEDKTIAWLQKEYKHEIKKHVSLKGHRGIEFDGVLEHLRYDIVFEVRYNPNPMTMDTILRRLLSEVAEYRNARGREVELHCVIVTRDEDRKNQITSYLSHIYKGMTQNIHGITVKFIVIKEAELNRRTTTDYRAFMDTVDWDELTIGEKQALYDAANGQVMNGGIPFDVQPYGNDEKSVLLSYINSDLSLLLTEQSWKLFPKWLEDTYMDGEDGNTYLGIQAAMEKDD